MIVLLWIVLRRGTLEGLLLVRIILVSVALAARRPSATTDGAAISKQAELANADKRARLMASTYATLWKGLF